MYVSSLAERIGWSCHSIEQASWVFPKLSGKILLSCETRKEDTVLNRLFLCCWLGRRPQLTTICSLERAAIVSLTESRSGELRTQKLKSHLLRTQSLKVLPLKPGVGQYIAIHATLTATDFFLAYFYPSSPPTCIFSKASPDFFPALAVVNTGSCVGPQNEIGHPAGCRFPCWVPAEYKQAKKKWLVVWWLVKWLISIWSEVCVQPWCNPLWLTRLKAPTN